MTLHPVILTGGAGTRLWPLSREYYPKPFLSLTSNQSMFQEAVSRLIGIENASNPIIVCNEEHRFLVTEHLSQINKLASTIILEPVGRNTAPASTLAALEINRKYQAANNGDIDDDLMLVMPADHIINDVPTFQTAINQGSILAKSGKIVTFGITPASAKTGYGYIKKGAPLNQSTNLDTSCFIADVFVEKPDKPTADKMVSSGEYLWNSGIFMMSVKVWLEQMEIHHPRIVEYCQDAYNKGTRDGYFFRPDSEIFNSCPNDSIDYAIMEKIVGQTSTSSVQCALLEMNAEWSDIGSWTAIWDVSNQDDCGNVIAGDIYTHSVNNSLMIGQSRLLAAVGLSDLIVIETSDAVLVVHKDYVQDIKTLVEQLKPSHQSELENHRKVHRPWGSYETVDTGPTFQVKRLTVNPGESLSLQKHQHRAEHWVVVKGTAKVTKGEEEFILNENQSTYVPVNMSHRLENQSDTPLEIIEVQSGDYLGEDDIERIEDRYHRL